MIECSLKLRLNVLLTVGAQLGTSTIAIVEVAISLRVSIRWLHTKAVSIAVTTVSMVDNGTVAGVSCVWRRRQMTIAMSVPSCNARAVAPAVEALAAIEVGRIESVVLGVGTRRVLGTILGSRMMVIVGVVSAHREASLDRVWIDVDRVPVRA